MYIKEAPQWILDLFNANGNKKSDKSTTIMSEELATQCETDTSSMDDIAELLEPEWTEGKRHYLSLSLCGLFAKSGWSWAMAETHLRKIMEIANDDEIEDRLRALQDTYQKFQRGEEIKGYTGLQDLIPETILKKLTEYVEGVSVPYEMKQVDALRKLNPAHIRHRKIAEFVRKQLTNDGEFIRTPEFLYYYFDKTKRKLFAIHKESIDLHSILNFRFGLNPLEQETKLLIADLITHAHSQGKEVEVFRMCHYDKIQKVLYVDLGDGYLARLNGKKIETVNNGTDGILFLDEIEAVVPNVDSQVNVKTLLIDDLNFSDKSESQSIMIWNWLRCLFFFALLPARPILAFIGNKGAGKTTFNKRLLRLFFGENRTEPDDVKTQDDFESAVCNNYILALDNVDGEVKWLNDCLATVATGATIRQRKLYRNLEEVSVKPRCFVTINSRSPYFRREDVADRLLIVRLDRIPDGNFKTEKKMLKCVSVKNRGKLFGALLNELNQCVAYLQNNILEDSSKYRMADWTALALTFSAKDGQLETFQRALGEMENERVTFTLEDSPLVEFIPAWSDGKWRTSGEMVKLIKEKEDDPTYRSGKPLTTELQNAKESLVKGYGMKCKFDKHNRRWEYCFPIPAKNEGRRVA